MQARFLKGIRIFISLALLVVLILIQLVGVLHTHTDSFIRSKNCLSRSHDKNQSPNNEVVNISDKCKICDFTFHHHSPFIVSNSPVSVMLLPEVLLVPVSGKCCKIFEAAVQGWTNKGPPVFIS